MQTKITVFLCARRLLLVHGSVVFKIFLFNNYCFVRSNTFLAKNCLWGVIIFEGKRSNDKDEFYPLLLAGPRKKEDYTKKIEKIMTLGSDMDTALVALSSCNWDLEKAIEQIFGS